MEGTPNREGQGQALPCKAGEETGARIDRSEPPREREPRPGAEPRPQQVGRQKRSGYCIPGYNSPSKPPLRFERLWPRQLLPDYSIRERLYFIHQRLYFFTTQCVKTYTPVGSLHSLMTRCFDLVYKLYTNRVY